VTELDKFFQAKLENDTIKRKCKILNNKELHKFVYMCPCAVKLWSKDMDECTITPMGKLRNMRTGRF
jgi:hypothetical protein